MSAGDWVIVAILLLSTVTAVAQGFFQEVFSLAGVVVGFLLASWEYHAAAERLSFMNPPWVADIIGFFVIFLVVAIIAGIIGKIASWGMKQAGLRAIDRLLGGAFGVVRGALIVTVMVMVTAAFAPQSEWLTRSELAPYFLVAGRAASWLAPAEVRNRVRDGIQMLPKGKGQTENAKVPAGSSTEPEKNQTTPGGK
jgi:membrane protein required for colicin V production